MYDSELHSGGFRGGAWGGGAPYLLFLDQSDAQRAEENFLGDCTPLISRSGSGTAASHSHIKAYQRCNHQVTKWVFWRRRRKQYVFCINGNYRSPRWDLWGRIPEGHGFESQSGAWTFSKFPFDAKNVSFSSSSSKDSLSNLNVPSI